MSAPREDMGWADRPEVKQRIRNALYVICAALVAADFVMHRHVVYAIERIPAFYALYGFVALVAVVLLAKGLRRLVGRAEDYYENGGGDA